MTRPDLVMLLQGTPAYLRELMNVLERGGISSYTGPLPGST